MLFRSAYVAVLAGVFVTAFYSFRMYFLVFHGKERFDQNPEAHHDAHQDPHSHAAHAAAAPHESPGVVTLPLVLLAIPSMCIGFITIEPMLFSAFFEGAIVVNADIHKAMVSLQAEFHGPLQLALHGLNAAPFWLALAGVASAYYLYLVKPAWPALIRSRFEPLYTLLDNKYYMDWINENLLARGARALGTGLWRGGDQALIDGLLVNGSWKLVARLSGLVRQLQTGYLYHYALVMILGVFVLMTYFVWLK